MIAGHFNKLSPAEAERLAILVEEAGEIIQVVGKILRHGYASHNPMIDQGQSNRGQLERELADFRAAMGILIHAGDVNAATIESLVDDKCRRLQRWVHHQPSIIVRLDDPSPIETTIRQAVQDYHFALDKGEHGGAAQNKAFDAIRDVLGMHWRRGDETQRRGAEQRKGGEP